MTTASQPIKAAAHLIGQRAVSFHIKRIALLVLLITFSILTKRSLAQTSCLSALNMGNSGGDTAVFSGSSVWFRFQASGNTHQLNIGLPLRQTPELDIEVFSGTCGSLSTIEGPISFPRLFDVVSLELSGLSANTYYYLVLTSDAPGITYVSSAQQPTPCGCIIQPAPCEQVCNGGFEQSGSGFGTGFVEYNIERACPWVRVSDTSAPFAQSPDHWFGAGSNFGALGASDGAAGVVAGMNAPGFEWQEYLYTELGAPIPPGDVAVVRYYIRTATHFGDSIPSPLPTHYYRFATDHFAAVLSHGVINQVGPGPIAPPTGSIEIDYNTQIPPGWTQVVEVVQNSTGSDLDHITLGTFEADSNLTYTTINNSATAHLAYVYIDDVSVHSFSNCSSLQACEGDDVTIGFPNLSASGLTFQWYDNQGMLLVGETSTTLDLGQVLISNSGMYGLSISDGTHSYTVDFELSVYDCCDLPGVTQIFGGTSSALPTTSWNNTQRVIYGTFVVDNAFSISNSTIHLGTGAEIHIANGASLTIDHSTLQACEDLWGRVYATTNSTLSVNNSTFKEAVTALHIHGGCNFTISGTNHFTNNHTGIRLLDRTVVTNINDCHFSSTSNLLPPYANQTGYSGIQAIDCLDYVHIGPSTGCTFDSLRIGVFSRGNDKELSVRNSSFNQISYSNSPPFPFFFQPGAIQIFHSNRHTITDNTFQFCSYAVRENNGGNFQFLDNLVNHISRAGILLFHSSQKFKRIASNNFYNLKRGIRIVGNHNIHVRITDNHFEFPIGGHSSYAILQSNYTTASGNGGTAIHGNEIWDFGHGIVVRNQHAPLIEGNDIYNVHMNNQYLTEGIHIENCLQARVKCNGISGMTTPSQTSFFTVAGVRSTHCIEQRVINNHIMDVGRAIQANAMQQNSKLLANKIEDCPVGVFLNNGVIGPQFDFYFGGGWWPFQLRPQDNEWIGIGSQNTYYTFAFFSNGNLSPFYYRNTPNPLWDMNMANSGWFGTPPPAPVPYILYNNFTGPSLVLPCYGNVWAANGLPENPNTPLNDEEAIAIMLDTTSVNMFSPDEAAKHWLEQQALYIELLNDTTDFTSNQNLTTFFNARSQEEFGDIEQIDSLVRVYYETGVLQAGINGNNLWDLWTASEYPVQSYREFYDIYVDHIGERDSFFVFDDTELTQLIDLAERCPAYHGRAVIHARAVLDMIDTVDYTPNSCEYALNPTGRSGAEVADEEEVWVRVYPNPASDHLYVLKSKESKFDLSVRITDLAGRLVFSGHIVAKDYFKSFDISSLSVGMYLIHLEGDDYYQLEKVVVGR